VNGLVTIKAWRRPSMLEKVLNGLVSCIGIDRYNVMLSIDKNNLDTKIFDQLVENSGISSVCKSIDVVYQDISLGCAGNMKYCFEYTFQRHYEYMIHLEDDTVPFGDYLNLADYFFGLMQNDPELLLGYMRLPGTDVRKDTIFSDPSNLHLCIKRDWMAPCGGFVINRDRYFNILDQHSKLFGRGHDTWARYFNLKYRGESLFVLPLISRAQNIGDVGGAFNLNAQWHAEKIHSHHWVGSNSYKDVDFNSIDYELIDRVWKWQRNH
jgi:hypothetical protein